MMHSEQVLARHSERQLRSQETPIVGGLPAAQGINAAMRLTPGLGTHLRGLADELLVKDFPGATLTRAERELIATAVSSKNHCFYSMDSHGAFALELLQREVAREIAAHGLKPQAVDTRGIEATIEGIKSGESEGVSGKVAVLLEIARLVQGDPLALLRADVERARQAGASDGDVQLAVLIAAAFCMYSRIIDGLRTETPAHTDAYRARAIEVADRGYGTLGRPSSIPR
jgi:AhpD family alkylhydroperoxidase